MEVARQRRKTVSSASVATSSRRCSASGQRCRTSALGSASMVLTKSSKSASASRMWLCWARAGEAALITMARASRIEVRMLRMRFSRFFAKSERGAAALAFHPGVVANHDALPLRENVATAGGVHQVALVVLGGVRQGVVDLGAAEGVALRGVKETQKMAQLMSEDMRDGGTSGDLAAHHGHAAGDGAFDMHRAGDAAGDAQHATAATVEDAAQAFHKEDAGTIEGGALRVGQELSKLSGSRHDVIEILVALVDIKV